MSVVHYNSGVFYAWIDGVLTTIPIGNSNGPIHGLNSPLVIDELNDPFEPILFNQPSLDNVAYRNRTNAFTGANSFSALIDLLSGQIKFPAAQNASADVNILDDYEEGEFTPIFLSDGGNSGQVYDQQSGYYTKIGDHITIWLLIRLSTLGTFTGNIFLGGFPFVSKNLALSGGFGNGAMFWNGWATAFTVMQSSILINSTTAIIVCNTAAATGIVRTLTQADTSGAAFPSVRACITYKV